MLLGYFILLYAGTAAHQNFAYAYFYVLPVVRCFCMIIRKQSTNIDSHLIQSWLKGRQIRYLLRAPGLRPPNFQSQGPRSQTVNNTILYCYYHNYTHTYMKITWLYTYVMTLKWAMWWPWNGHVSGMDHTSLKIQWLCLPMTPKPLRLVLIWSN